jgi:hypothetical protein
MPARSIEIRMTTKTRESEKAEEQASQHLPCRRRPCTNIGQHAGTAMSQTEIWRVRSARDHTET